jgi:hypothetical protein
MSISPIVSTLSVGFLAFNVAAPSFAESLNESLYGTGTVLGRIIIESSGANGSPQSEEVDAMLQFFQDGGAEYDFRSLVDSSISCSGELIFIEYMENTDWQSLELQLVPEESNSDNCPPTGFLSLSRRPDATNSDPIKVGFRPESAEAPDLFLAGAVYLTEGVPEYRDLEAKGEVETVGSEVGKVPSSVAGSSNYPLYDGVYVGLRDGSFVQMEELVRADSRLHFGGPPFAITLPFGTLADNRLPTVVRVEDIRSIFVKSPTDVVTSIQPVFDAVGLLFQGGEIVPAYINVGGNDYHLELFFDLLAPSDCAYLPTQLNRLTISEFEYELVFDGAQVQPSHLAMAPVNRRWSASEPVFDPGAGSDCSGKVAARGFSVTVEGPTHKGINALAGPVRGTVFWVQFPE